MTPRYVSTAEFTFDYNPLNGTPTAFRPSLREWFLISRNEILSRTSLSTIIQEIPGSISTRGTGRDGPLRMSSKI